MRRSFLAAAAAALVAVGSVRALGAEIPTVAPQSAYLWDASGSPARQRRCAPSRRGRSTAQQKRMALKRRNRLRHKAHCKGKKA